MLPTTSLTTFENHCQFTLRLGGQNLTFFLQNLLTFSFCLLLIGYLEFELHKTTKLIKKSKRETIF